MPTRTHSLNAERFASFTHAYRAGLAKAIEEHPEEYADGVKNNVFGVATRMLEAVERGSYNHDGRGFKNACKALGLKHTRKAIEAYLKGE